MPVGKKPGSLSTAEWRMLATMGSLWMIVDFNREDGQPTFRYFHIRHYPLNGHYQTTQWIPGELLRDELMRKVDVDVAPGRYKVVFTVDANMAPEDRMRTPHEVSLGPIDILP